MAEADELLDDGRAGWRHDLHTIIFEAETPAGKAFDVTLLVAILASIAVVSLDTVETFALRHGAALEFWEWFFTALFTVEYVLRLICVRRPARYAVSFFGVIDFLSILPTWLGLFGIGASSVLVLRSFRLLRVFRIFKLGRFVSEAAQLRTAFVESRAKITVFLSAVLVIVVVIGSALYQIEGKESGFDSIPQSMYWAIVTLTTVGYGDIAPETPMGKALAAVLMLLGYSLIIVPTSLVAAELAQSSKAVTTHACPSCMLEGHDHDALHCKRCGARL